MQTLTEEQRTELEAKKVLDAKNNVVLDFEKRIERLIPPRYRKVEKKDLSSDILTKFKDKEKQGLYICGEAGVGKTHIGYCLVKEILEFDLAMNQKKIDDDYSDYKKKWDERDDESKEYAQKVGFNLYRPNSDIFKTSVGLYNFPVMLQEIRNSYDDGNPTMNIEQYNEKFLIIDDIGAEKFSEWSIENLYRLVNYRYEKMLKSVFISNLSLKELSEKAGDRIASRISEMCHIVKIKGKDRRLN